MVYTYLLYTYVYLLYTSVYLIYPPVYLLWICCSEVHRGSTMNGQENIYNGCSDMGERKVGDEPFSIRSHTMDGCQGVHSER